MTSYLTLSIVTSAPSFVARSARHNTHPRERDCSRQLRAERERERLRVIFRNSGTRSCPLRQLIVTYLARARETRAGITVLYLATAGILLGYVTRRSLHDAGLLINARSKITQFHRIRRNGRLQRAFASFAINPDE